jgi:hypothetical protein
MRKPDPFGTFAATLLFSLLFTEIVIAAVH